MTAPVIQATTETKGNFKVSFSPSKYRIDNFQNTACRRYIGAKERDSEKISMTAPVIQTTNDESENWTVSFAMPSKYNIDNLPKPANDEIYFEEIQPSLAAVIRFSGVADTSLLTQKASVLKRWLELNGYTESSSPKFLFYNDPTTPGFLRRNEVMIIIDK